MSRAGRDLFGHKRANDACGCGETMHGMAEALCRFLAYRDQRLVVQVCTALRQGHDGDLSRLLREEPGEPEGFEGHSFASLAVELCHQLKLESDAVNKGVVSCLFNGAPQDLWKHTGVGHV